MAEHAAVNRRVVGSSPTRGAMDPVPLLGQDFFFMSSYLYILTSQTANKYYVGYSDDPELRVHYHNTLEKGFTARYRPWELVFTREFSSRLAAQRAERKVKSWKSRVMIEKLIRGETTL